MFGRHHQALAGGSSISELHRYRVFGRHHQALAGGSSISELSRDAGCEKFETPPTEPGVHKGPPARVAPKLKYHRLKPGGVGGVRPSM
jgi:hypothetical protein